MAKARPQPPAVVSARCLPRMTARTMKTALALAVSNCHSRLTIRRSLCAQSAGSVLATRSRWTTPLTRATRPVSSAVQRPMELVTNASTVDPSRATTKPPADSRRARSPRPPLPEQHRRPPELVVLLARPPRPPRPKRETRTIRPTRHPSQSSRSSTTQLLHTNQPWLLPVRQSSCVRRVFGLRPYSPSSLSPSPSPLQVEENTPRRRLAAVIRPTHHQSRPPLAREPVASHGPSLVNAAKPSVEAAVALQEEVAVAVVAVAAAR